MAALLPASLLLRGILLHDRSEAQGTPHGHVAGHAHRNRARLADPLVGRGSEGRLLLGRLRRCVHL